VHYSAPSSSSCNGQLCNGSNSPASKSYGSPASAPASEPEVLIDEEIFAATMRILTDGFLRMPSEGLFDVYKTAADASSLIAITNTFVTQPWKRWLYLGIPGLCKVRPSSSSSSSSSSTVGQHQLHMECAE
jgi:hypothetical protein